MEIKISSNIKDISCDILVVNQFEGEKTTEEIANKFRTAWKNIKGNVDLIYVPFFIDLIGVEGEIPLLFLFQK